MKAKDIKKVRITNSFIDLDSYMAVVRYGAELEIADDFMDRVRAGRKLIDKFLS